MGNFSRQILWQYFSCNSTPSRVSNYAISYIFEFLTCLHENILLGATFWKIKFLQNEYKILLTNLFVGVVRSGSLFLTIFLTIVKLKLPGSFGGYNWTKLLEIVSTVFIRYCRWTSSPSTLIIFRVLIELLSYFGIAMKAKIWKFVEK